MHICAITGNRSRAKVAGDQWSQQWPPGAYTTVEAETQYTVTFFSSVMHWLQEPAVVLGTHSAYLLLSTSINTSRLSCNFAWVSAVRW